MMAELDPCDTTPTPHVVEPARRSGLLALAVILIAGVAGYLFFNSTTDQAVNSAANDSEVTFTQ